MLTGTVKIVDKDSMYYGELAEIVDTTVHGLYGVNFKKGLFNPYYFEASQLLPMRETFKANIEAYQALCAIADKIQWPITYRNDLYQVDREYLTGKMGIDAPTVFGFVFRDYGTHIDDPRRKDKYGIDVEHTYTNIWNHENCRFYWVKDNDVTEVDFD